MAFRQHVFGDLYDDGNLEPVPDPVEGFEELQEEMRIRETVKRSQFSLTMNLGDGLNIGVKGWVGCIIHKDVARCNDYSAGTL